jgi:folate-dependent phosphoribosylglycinamide formyltransferase PurN
MRIALLCDQGLSDFQQRVLATIFELENHVVCVGVVDHRKRPSPLKKLKRNLRKGRGGYVLVMAWNQFFGRKEPSRDTVAFLRERDVPVVRARKPYSDETVEAILETEPDVLVLIGGFGIIKKRWLELCPHGVLSYHHGDMRKYRGQPPCFWELYNDEKEIGVTVQRLSPGLDNGEPIVESHFEIRPDDTPATLHGRIYDGSVGMMAEAVRRVADPAFQPATITTFGDVYTLPNFRQWIVYKIRMLRRHMRRI